MKTINFKTVFLFAVLILFAAISGCKKMISNPEKICLLAFGMIIM